MCNKLKITPKHYKISCAKTSVFKLQRYKDK